MWAVGLAVTAALYLVTSHQEERRVAEAFHGEALAQQALLHARLQSYIEQLRALRSGLRFSGEISRDGFRGATSEMLARTPGISGLEWVPLVPAAEREAYEQRARADGLAGFEFRDRRPDGAFVRAADRPEYLPIYYVEPIAGNEVGARLRCGARAHPFAHVRAEATGEVAGHARPFSLAQETGATSSAGWSCARSSSQPRWPGGAPVLRGFFQGVFRLSPMLSSAWQDYRKAGVDILVLDPEAPRRRSNSSTTSPPGRAPGRGFPPASEFRRGLHRRGRFCRGGSPLGAPDAPRGGVARLAAHLPARGSSRSARCCSPGCSPATSRNCAAARRPCRRW